MNRRQFFVALLAPFVASFFRLFPKKPKVYFDKSTTLVGYKGTTPYDAGYFYCPYIPLNTTRLIGATFVPPVSFKTRYGSWKSEYYSPKTL
jgi:hypothetical protein